MNSGLGEGDGVFLRGKVESIIQAHPHLKTCWGFYCVTVASSGILSSTFLVFKFAATIPASLSIFSCAQEESST